MTDFTKYYQAKKPVFIYLETDPIIQGLKAKLKNEKKAYFTTEGRDKIKTVWESKTYNYIVWTYRTNQEERWIVVVLDAIKKTATIHTASQSTEANKEKEEVVGFLSLLSGLTNAKNPTLDQDLKTRKSQESSYVAILYVLKILKAIDRSDYLSRVDTSDFEDKESDGKTKIQKVEERFKELEAEIAKVPSLNDLEKKGTPLPNTETKTAESIKADIEKLLKDTETKWTNYLNQPNSTDLNIRMFKGFRETAKSILPLIEKALKSPKEFKDYFSLNKEWGNNSHVYDQSRDFLNAWYTFRILLKEWETLNEKSEQKPVSTLSEDNKKKLIEYEELKREKEKSSKRIASLETQLIEKSQPKPKAPPPPTLADKFIKDIQENINQAYNSTKYLKGYYDRLMERFLNWEYSSSRDQKKAIKEKKTEVQKCANYLKEELLKT